MDIDIKLRELEENFRERLLNLEKIMENFEKKLTEINIKKELELVQKLDGKLDDDEMEKDKTENREDENFEKMEIKDKKED